MIEATSCGGVVIFRGKVLLLYKNYKNKYEGWVLPKGTVEKGEEHNQTALREVKEETGLDLVSWRYCGIVTFIADDYPAEYMHLYLSDEFTGSISDCDEGELEWIRKEDIFDLPIWPGDRIFLRLMQEKVPFFSLKLVYRKDELIHVSLNGRPLADSSLPADLSFLTDCSASADHSSCAGGSVPADR